MSGMLSHHDSFEVDEDIVLFASVKHYVDKSVLIYHTQYSVLTTQICIDIQILLKI